MRLTNVCCLSLFDRMDQLYDKALQHCTTSQSKLFCPSWQRCFVLRVFTASHKTKNKVVWSLMDSRHHTIFRTMFCPSWIHDIMQYSEQCCFVPHGFTTSHNIQNNVDLFFIASRHQAIIRTTIMRHYLTTSRDRRNNVVLSFVASRYHAIV